MWIWKLLGWTSLGAGIIGIALPVVPTVPFWILAAFCFERGSPEIHKWLIAHPTFGPPLKQWREHRVIAPRSKAIAVICISLSVIYVFFFRAGSTELKMVMLAICLSVILFILTRKSRV